MTSNHIDPTSTQERFEELQKNSKQLETQILLTLQQIQDPYNTTSQ